MQEGDRVEVLWKRGMTLALVVFGALISGCGDKKVAEAKSAIEVILKDPSSAQYRNLRVYSEGVVCGEVNAKNSMGGYAGFTPFIYNGEELSGVKMGARDFDFDDWCNDSLNKREAHRQRALAAQAAQQLEIAAAKEKELREDRARCENRSLTEGIRKYYCESAAKAKAAGVSLK